MPHNAHKLDLQDNICLMKMDWASFVCKRILPQGYWGSDRKVSSADKTLYLTYDDGPHPATTPALLDLFDQENVRATFFVVGSRVRKNPELVQEIVKRGHTVGNHTTNHPFLPYLTTNNMEAEIGETIDLIGETAGSKPVLFRPPYGLLDHRGASIVREREMRTVYWGAVSEDWHGIGERRVVARTMQRVEHGQLIVLHENRRISEQTLSATREIIKLSKALGFSFASIPTH